MQNQSQKPLNSAVTQQRSRVKKKKQRLEFSKRLTLIDIVTWVAISILLLVVMIAQPSLAPYCVNIFTAATAAYVSLRLGYTAKAGVENYKKIANTYSEVMDTSEQLESNG